MIRYLPFRAAWHLGGFILSALLLALLASCGSSTPPPQATSGAMVERVTATSITSLQVEFSAPVEKGAENPDNYTVTSAADETLGVLAAHLSEDGTTVYLATEAQTPDARYFLSVQGIMSASGQEVDQEDEKDASFESSSVPAPVLASAVALSNTQVLLTFVNPDTNLPVSLKKTANNEPFYEINGLEITNAQLVAENTKVMLTTSSQEDREYTVRVTNITDETGRLIDYRENEATFHGMPKNDTVPPKVVGAAAISGNTVQVSFSEPVGEKAANLSNYTIIDPFDTPLVVKDVELNHPFNTVATLHTEGQVQGMLYTLTVSGIGDGAGNAMSEAGSQATFSGLSVSNDEDALPRVSGAGATDPTHVIVTFSKPMNKESLENVNHYRISTIKPDTGLSDRISTQATLQVMEAVQIAPTAVKLTTLPQASKLYYVKVTNVVDTDGNQLAPKTLVHDPSVTSFVGLPPSGPLEDTDGDGLSDFFEGKGWDVTVTKTGGEVSTSHVTSDPFKADTDGDGLGDRTEAALVTSPRSGNTDGDNISDEREFNYTYSEPVMQDTDGDGLFDGLEFNFFHTSPILADTDGDQFLDFEEIKLDNRNPRIADLPRFIIDTGNVDLQLDVRFAAQTSEGTTTIDQKTVSSTLSESASSSQSATSSNTLAWFFKAGLKVTGELSFGKTGFKGAKIGGEFSAEGGVNGSTTNSYTQASAQATAREYSNSLSTSEQVSSEATVTRTVQGASMGLEVNIINKGNIAFTISDIEITALIQDPRDPRSFTPVATLSRAIDEPFSIGPLNPVRGPFRFTAIEVFPNLVESLMRNPRFLVFRVASYQITDEFGRNFAFVEQDINDRTAMLEIDYAGNAPLERVHVATNSHFNAVGEPVGLTMHQIMQEVLGLQFVPPEVDETLDPDIRKDAELLDDSYSTRMIDGIETLWRVRRVSNALTDPDRQWWVITPLGYDPSLDFGDIIVKSDQSFAFKFVQDLDGDLLEASQEFSYGTIDSDEDNNGDGIADSRDTDRDGIEDADEVYGLFEGNKRIPWKVRVRGQDAYNTYPHPGRPDSDFDGLTDCQELIPEDPQTDEVLGCATIKFYQGEDGVPTLESYYFDADGNRVNRTVAGSFKLEAATDPTKPDTDEDGIPDVQELIGFAYLNLVGDPVIITRDTDPDTSFATDPLSHDTDGDGLEDFQELKLGTDPTRNDGDSVRDNDGDGLVNLRENSGWNIFVNNHAEHVTSNPELPDTDGDSLNDWEEFKGCRDADRNFACDSTARFGPSDPGLVDSDKDCPGVEGADWDPKAFGFDLEETCPTHDRAEVDGFAFPADKENPARFTDPLDIDTDNDSANDWQELFDPWDVQLVNKAAYEVSSDPLDPDADGDDLVDGSERSNGTDPNNPDTDGDETLDSTEVAGFRGTNPLEPDFLVTVTYMGVQAGKDGDRASADCDDGGNPGEFWFHLDVGIPSPAYTTRDFDVSIVASSWTVPARTCGNDSDSGPCGRSGFDTYVINLAAPQEISMYESRSFAVAETELFTLEGVVQELDPGGADESYFFGGFGGPSGTYLGTSLEKGTVKAINFSFTGKADFTNEACYIDVYAQYTVE